VSASRPPDDSRRLSQARGRIGDHEILSSRLIDRTIRPLFPEGFRNETQVQVTVLSYEPGTDPETLAITGAAAALHISDIPFDGPVAGVRIARTAAGSWRPFPPRRSAKEPRSTLLFRSSQRLVMIEGEAQEAPEVDLIEALRFGPPGDPAAARLARTGPAGRWRRSARCC